MRSSRVSRAAFIALSAAAQAAVSVPGTARAQTPAAPAAPQKLRKSLVLSGGGALGAYEAGVIQHLIEASGVREGQPLPDHGVVCGTSIGALNAFLVATAQWSKVRGIWQTISSENVIRLKPEYQKITNPSSGVLSRIWEAISIALGSGKDVQGVIDGENLRRFMLAYLNLDAKIVTPMIWAVTNLSRQLPEYFYLLPDGFGDERKQYALRALAAAAGPAVALREADRPTLVDQLRASAAVPLAFDPVTLSDGNGKPAQYVDGGVTQNTPISAARALSSEVDAVLLSPPYEEQRYDNLIEIGLGSFGTMQRVLMIESIRVAYLESIILQQVRVMKPEEVSEFGRLHGFHAAELDSYARLLGDTAFAVLRPLKPLPAKLFGFDNAKAISDTFEAGRKDAAGGFLPFSDSMVDS
jgi:NTE family protein